MNSIVYIKQLQYLGYINLSILHLWVTIVISKIVLSMLSKFNSQQYCIVTFIFAIIIYIFYSIVCHSIERNGTYQFHLFWVTMIAFDIVYLFIFSQNLKHICHIILYVILYVHDLRIWTETRKVAAVEERMM